MASRKPSRATALLLVLGIGALAVLALRGRHDATVGVTLGGGEVPGTGGDQHTMRVVRYGTREDMRGAARTLLRLERDFRAFLQAAAARYKHDDAPAKILRRWNGKLYETREHAAITEDKKRIRVCIRDSASKLLPYEVTKFVVLHELAHVANNSWGHDRQFWDSFKKLLEMASELKFITGPIPRHTTYCGSQIGSDPSACVRARTCDSAINLTRAPVALMTLAPSQLA